MHRKTAVEINKLFVSGTTTAEEIAKYFLNRIQNLDSSVGAFLQVYPEHVLKTARALDEKKAANKPLGKLAGIPIAIKDNIHIKGERTTCASKMIANYEALFDATVTRLVKEEDALIIGKTNLDEFAMGGSTEHSAFLKTHNPWNLKCTAGGSSGGSAAAVAARLCPLSLGSDTGGSVRQPASYCGLVGFKPTYGRVSRYGLVAFGSSLDQVGPFAYNTEDLALLQSVLGAPCNRDATSIDHPKEDISKFFKTDLKGLRVGVPYDFLDNLSSEMRESFDNSLEVLKELGAELVEVNLAVLKYSMATYYIVGDGRSFYKPRPF